jgi:Protein of unknown function (DUF5818)
MKRTILTTMALALALPFGLVQIASGTVFAQNTPAMQQQRQDPQQPATQGQSQYPQVQGKQARELQYFIGTIEKHQGKFVLATSTKTYKLDSQSKAANYNGKQVQVMGTLAMNGNMIHIKQIKTFKASS